ncbi:MAG TPA: Rrf2 family transcriptional regulator [Phototrophicaceae bacterium]|jgi:Rrf2 family protein|nr:Rrf2 family transcriptional regulator [Phototrophicaceae bacterium]
MSYSLAFSEAVFILIFVGSKVEQGLYEFIPTGKISQELDIPPSTAGMILRRLNRSGIIETREGANGGIRLAIPPEKLTVFAIFEAIEQERPLFQINQHPKLTGEKAGKAQQAMLQLFNTAESAMKAELKRITIRDLMNKISE